jgi:hypothetical protein
MKYWVLAVINAVFVLATWTYGSGVFDDNSYWDCFVSGFTCGTPLTNKPLPEHIPGVNREYMDAYGMFGFMLGLITTAVVIVLQLLISQHLFKLAMNRRT